MRLGMTFFHFVWRPEHFLPVFLVLVSVTTVLYLALAGASTVLCAVLQKRRPQPDKSAYPRRIGKAIRWSVLNIVGNAILTGGVVVLIANGHSRVYYSIGDYGWSYLAASALALILFTETLVYWIHRGLHGRFLYRCLHQYHHEFRAPNSWVSMAFHPADSFSQAAPYHIFAFLFPTWVGLYAGALVLVTLWTFLIHDEMLLCLPSNIVNFTSHHEIHHFCNKYNYGQFFTFWDRLAKTHRSPEQGPSP